MRNHLIIAGAGRAGTSFLVKYLHGCGLDTIIAHGGLEGWDDNANAGLESFVEPGRPLPYVIKSAWFHESIREFLAQPDLKLDAVIVPMRDLIESAASRVINEQVARLQDPLIVPSATRWERWGTTPGGVVFSLNPLDQARILALNFHEAILELVRHDVPLVFLDFPRLIEDPDYLYRKLAAWLPDSCSAEAARRTHASLADTTLVRTGAEIHAGAGIAEFHTRMQYPTPSELGEVARKRAARTPAPRASLPRRAAQAVMRRLRGRTSA